ncbi:MAG: hypothetical protein ABWY95_04815, partial [Thermoleophilaceae bacterium]
MDDLFERALGLIADYDRQLRATLPEGADIFDAHVHLGLDIDGFRGIYEELEKELDAFSASRCFMFCMDEPDRHPAFRAPNDRSLEWGQRSVGR